MKLLRKSYKALLTEFSGKECIVYQMFGSYQGEWVGAVDDGDNIELWRGSYGSCSGCDFIEHQETYDADGNKEWIGDFISSDSAVEYFKNEKPFAVIPKETLRRVDFDTFVSFLPRNVINDSSFQYDGESEDNLEKLYNEIIKSI
jgi:hypothetical protein